jgi:hypothetical protein
MFFFSFLVEGNMASDKEKELKEENEKLKELLKETMMAMCDYRTIKGYCAQCNDAMFCRAKHTIPKVEKLLKLKRNLK